MKKSLFIMLGQICMFFGACMFTMNANAQEYSIVITGDFESKCLLPNEGQYYLDELPQVMVACQNRYVTYTAHVSTEDDEIVAWNWVVNGADGSICSGNIAHVTWGNGPVGELIVTVTTASGRTLSGYQSVRLIENPVASASSVPASIDGTTIFVCRGESVEFTDQSHAESSDIVGYYWNSPYGEASTHSYTIDNVYDACEVIHRVYNNCGCYDEEIFHIEVLDGEPLRIDCYGTACEGSTVAYHASAPPCDDYYWIVEGGQIITGQHTQDFTVLWDSPQNGYGIISLDGNSCGAGACPNKLSVKIPIIQNGVSVSGQTSVCEGEAVVYSVPLYGSTRYSWNITPSVDTVPNNGANMITCFFHQAGTYQISVKYKCDFLACGEFYSDTITVTVKPRLEITGDDEVCITNACTLSTSPSDNALWKVLDLSNNQTIYSSNSPEASPSISFSHSGRYKVTAHNANYCNEPTFYLTVKDAPPAPTINNMDSHNPSIACPNDGIKLKGYPDNPDYNLIWETTCNPVSSASGGEVTIRYGATICDVNVYTYDRQLGCKSATPYVHHVEQFQLLPTNLPTGIITVCPGTRLVWTNANVPYQDNVLYEWQIQDNMQYCATIDGDNTENAVTLLVNEFVSQIPTTPFNVYLYRTYCSDFIDTTVVTIRIADWHNDTLRIDAQDTICQGSRDTLVGWGCNSNYSWSNDVDESSFSGNPWVHTFNQSGLNVVTMTCNPYDVCSNPNYYTIATKNIYVSPLPPLVSLGYSTNDVFTIPQLSTSDYSFSWQPTSANSYIIPRISGVSMYECTVTSLTSPYCSVTRKININTTPPNPCQPLQIYPNPTNIDYCNKEITFYITNPSGNTNNVVWTILGPSHGVPVYSGTCNSQITIPLTNVGNYVIQAQIDGSPCYTGAKAFTVDFLPDFTFEKKCTSIVIHNNSKYLEGSKQIVFKVNGVVQEPFPVEQEDFPFSSGDGGTFIFQLFKYNGQEINCPPAIISIEDSRNAEVTINSANTPQYQHHTCDNTSILLTASIASPHTIHRTVWFFDDNSKIDTSGNSVYHTFASHGSGFTYNIMIHVIDENGCLSEKSFSIYSHDNSLKEPSLEAVTPSTPVCEGSARTIKFLADGQNPPPTVYYDWSTQPCCIPNNNALDVNHTGNYSVIASNNYYCKASASRNVAFLNLPSAIIIPQKYHYCAGETIKLNGAPDNFGNYQYAWSINNSETENTDTYQTPSVEFVAPSMNCDLYINLTVTDNDNGCSASADQVVIHIHASPDAPMIDFGDNKCIDNPPVDLVCSGPVHHINWSNGDFGDHAYFYTPGPVTAYYYDLYSGCQSQISTIYIPSAPDFDALLSGCYKVCDDAANGQLPVYGMLPYYQPFNWFWNLDGGEIASDHGVFHPLWLPLQGMGNYNLNVDYFDGCMAHSKQLRLEEDESCKCQDIVITYEYKFEIDNECRMHYYITVKVCNNSESEKCFKFMDPLFELGNGIDIVSTYPGVSIPAGQCDYFEIDLVVTSLNPTSVPFRLIDSDCDYCTKDFAIDLLSGMDLNFVSCHEDYAEFDIYQVPEFSDVNALYYKFQLNTNGFPNVLAVWGTPLNVIDYYFDGTDVITGLCSLDIDNYNQDEACIYVLVCKDGEVCLLQYCIPIPELLERNREELSNQNHSAKSKSNTIQNSATDPRLMPNPTTGEVNVIGTNDEVVEVLVMDMNGRQMATFDNTSNFNISTLSSGIYIVRVKTHHDNTDKVTYLKLVKK